MSSRRRVGGSIKKVRGAKLALREEEVEEEVDEDLKDFQKANCLFKAKSIAKQRGKAAIQQEKILIALENENTANHIKKLNEKSNSCLVDSKVINLSEIELKVGIKQSANTTAPKIGLTKKNCITIQTMVHTNGAQYYLDLEINPKKKYSLKFTITSFNNNYFFVGLMRKDKVCKSYLECPFNGLLFKRFSCSISQLDCSKVLQGNLFGDNVKSGDSFEMRFCIEDQILEFSTLPEHENVVSKLDDAIFDISPKVRYVITLNTFNSLGFSFDSIQEVLSFPSYC